MVFQRGSVSYGGIEHAVVLYNIWLDASFTYKEYNFLSCFLDFVLTFSLYALFTLINNVFPLIRRQKQLHKVGDRQGNLLGGVSGGGGVCGIFLRGWRSAMMINLRILIHSQNHTENSHLVITFQCTFWNITRHLFIRSHVYRVMFSNISNLNQIKSKLELSVTFKLFVNHQTDSQLEQILVHL